VNRSPRNGQARGHALDNRRFVPSSLFSRLQIFSEAFTGVRQPAPAGPDIGKIRLLGHRDNALHRHRARRVRVVSAAPRCSIAGVSSCSIALSSALTGPQRRMSIGVRPPGVARWFLPGTANTSVCLRRRSHSRHPLCAVIRHSALGPPSSPVMPLSQTDFIERQSLGSREPRQMPRVLTLRKNPPS
jgi:hypothetical protein